MQPFTEEVVRVLKDIPEGFVVTYGQVARMAGSPRAARQVVRILHTMSEKHSLPWHRVVNIRGEISVPGDESKEFQRMLLQSEDVVFLADGRVDLSVFK
ncbi:MGMT family protein [Paenisporosarcina sp. TG20]|uniref:MGMT family protein n=1 Tax=Paenisporosarcina sp. TG20 TaxID=1211706 RepID=UPI0002FB4184|nr:MGMT family protein [Paenisporosarcina sp. TG20]